MRLAVSYAVLVVSLVLAGTVTFTPRRNFAAPTTSGSTQPSEAARKALASVIPKFQLRDTTLETVLDSIREWVEQSTGAKMEIRWRFITRAGIRQETDVSIDMRNATVEEILQTVLRLVDQSGRRLLFRVEGNTIVVTSMIDD